MNRIFATNVAHVKQSSRFSCTFLPTPNTALSFPSRACCVEPRIRSLALRHTSTFGNRSDLRRRQRQIFAGYHTQPPRMTRTKEEAADLKEENTELPQQENEAMRKKADMIMAKLEEIYPDPPNGFLTNHDPFTLLVATVLSAQCMDSTVNAVTPSLFAAADTPEKMRDLGVAKIQTLIKRIGLSTSKAKYLFGLSEAICTNHNGVVPQTLEDLKNLPGVGHKTASVVISQAFGTPAFPVDTHIHRLACRWGAGDARSVEKTEAALKQWFPDPLSWGELHIRIIAFGREYCPARKHDMDACPVCSFAATAESYASNRTSPGKFVAPKVHKKPYSIRLKRTDGPDSVGPIPGPIETASQNGSVAHKRERATAKVELQNAEHLDTQVSENENVAVGSVSKRRREMKNETVEKKPVTGKKAGGIAKPPAATGKKEKKPGRPKGSKAKTEKPKAPEGVRRSARIASQK